MQHFHTNHLSFSKHSFTQNGSLEERKEPRFTNIKSAKIKSRKIKNSRNGSKLQAHSKHESADMQVRGRTIEVALARGQVEYIK